ncbi:MAG: hypothetical protein ABIG61_15255 [Planctomycetota bacterium]
MLDGPYSGFNPADSIQFFQALGKQGSAFDYVSAFSRCSRAFTRTGKKVFVSETASIDTADNLVQAIAYCKTKEVDELLPGQWKKIRADAEVDTHIAKVA